MQTAFVCGKLCTAPEGDYYVRCSFDSNHIILRSRMPYHIIKCVKNHPGHNKIQCPYDATEYIDSDELTNHLLTCESKKSLCADRYELAELKARDLMGKNQSTPYIHDSAPRLDEDWSGPLDNENGSKIGLTYSSDDDDDTCEQLRGVGRGMMLNKPSPQKGMGRAALLKRIFREHQEKQRLENSISPSTEKKFIELNKNVTENQFDDV